MGRGRGETAAKADEETMLACWEWAQETMREHPYIIGVALLPTARKGVWRVQARAMSHVDGKAVAVAVQVTCEYPSAQYRTLAVAVFDVQHRLDAELAKEAISGA